MTMLLFNAAYRRFCWRFTWLPSVVLVLAAVLWWAVFAFLDNDLSLQTLTSFLLFALYFAGLSLPFWAGMAYWIVRMQWQKCVRHIALASAVAFVLAVVYQFLLMAIEDALHQTVGRFFHIEVLYLALMAAVLTAIGTACFLPNTKAT